MDRARKVNRKMESISEKLKEICPEVADSVQPAADVWWFGIRRKWWILSIVGAGTFMSALDTSIVNIALPTIGQSTHSSVSTIEWVILIYLITLCSSLLIFGRLADIYGKRVIYMMGVTLFAVGSLFCGLSGRIGLLIASRAFQALGGAMILSLGPAIVISAFPSRERGRSLGIQATMTYLGFSAGPALGGLLTQRFGWPYIFFINVPIGLLIGFVSSKVLMREKRGAVQPFDPAGAGMLVVTLAPLLFALSKGCEMGWRNPFVMGSFAVSAIAFVVFISIERTVSHPALDLKLFSNRMFNASVLAAYLCYLSSAAVNFLMPFYLLHSLGFGEAHSGLLLMATPIAMMCLTAPSGFISDKVGVRLPATLGMVVLSVGVFLLRGLGTDAGAHRIIPCHPLIGIGSGLFTSPNNSAIMGSAPRDRQGVAGAMLAAARTVGFASGVALAGVIYVSRMSASAGIQKNVAIANAMHAGVTVVACLVLVGAFMSAMRGKSVTQRRC